MKKYFLTLFFLFFYALILSGCCNHQWKEADCEQPALCVRCGQEDGEALGHDWQEAECVRPSVCSRCGAIGSDALGHSWVRGDCGEWDRCERCGKSGDQIRNHSWERTTCMESETCSICGEQNDVIPGHVWEKTNCDYPRKCVYCETREEEAVGHSWPKGNCEEPKTCSVCGEIEEPREHNWKKATCIEDGKCYLCDMVMEALGHDWGDTACGGCSRCDDIRRGYPGHTWKEATCLEPKTCITCGHTTGYTSDHSFGPWEKEGREVNRYCAVCDLQDAGGVMDSGQYDAFREVLIDSWDNNKGITLDIRGDGTFSGNFDGEVTGTWEMYGVLSYPLVEDTHRAGLNFYYTKDGENCVTSGSLVGLGRYNRWRIALNGEKHWLWTTNTAAGEGVSVESEESIDLEDLAGFWTSTVVTRNWQIPVETYDEISTDYSVEISEDGTFTAHLSREITGQLNREDEDDDWFSFEADDGSYIEFSISIENENELEIHCLGNGELMAFYMVQMTEEEKREYEEFHRQKEEILRENLLGEWTTSEYMNIHLDFSDRAEVYILEEPFTITVNPDGTFSGTVMDGEMRGNWFYGGPAEDNSDMCQVGMVYNYDDHPYGDYEAYWDRDGFYMIYSTTAGAFIYHFQKK